MSPSSLTTPAARNLSHRVVELCKRWNLQPQDITAGATLWAIWAGLTWAAFALSLLFIEVGETGEVPWFKAAIGGCLIAAGQWLAIRPHLHRPHRWLISTAAVWTSLCLLHLGAVGWIAPSTSNPLLRSVLGILYGSYVGLGVGIGQWWALKSQISQVWRWIPLSAGLWAVGIAFAWLIGGLLRAASGLFLGEVIGLLVGWGAIATLSGLGIVGLLYSPLNQHPKTR